MSLLQAVATASSRCQVKIYSRNRGPKSITAQGASQPISTTAAIRILLAQRASGVETDFYAAKGCLDQDESAYCAGDYSRRGLSSPDGILLTLRRGGRRWDQMSLQRHFLIEASDASENTEGHNLVAIRRIGEVDKAVKVALVDGIFTFIWNVVSCCLGVAVFLIGQYMDYKDDRTPIMYAVILVVSLLFTEASFSVGGATWNPTGPLAFWIAGVGDDTLLALLLRLPTMALGAAGGIAVATSLVPSTYRPIMGSGPQLTADLFTGAVTEVVMSFALNVIVLYVVLRVTRNRVLQTLIILVTILTLIHYGPKSTGPVMNPTDAFGWAYHNKTHASAKHYVVYWLSPYLGTVAGALFYRRVFGSPPAGASAAPQKEKQKEL
ncbi:hypothetical protein R1sor_004992 [Riccia sorocarpa]|uniref:Aquaporin n=1 Tax=Riccia sorocarpa TaxID=122646 RepID=A0ABD3HKG9_9MARC